MKKLLAIMMVLLVLGALNISAQDAIKIVTNHPDFKIKVKRCAASGKTVFIDLILNNVGTNDVENVTVMGGYWKTEAYDDEGNIYNKKSVSVKVANNKEYNNNTSGKFIIPTDVPMKLSVRIDNVSLSAEKVARLSLDVRCPGWGLDMNKPVKISNIPISRD